MSKGHGGIIKRIILLVLVFIAIYSNAFCDDIKYIAVMDSSLRHVERAESVATVKKGETLVFQGKVTSTTTQDVFRILVSNENGQIGWIESSHVIPINWLPLDRTVTDKIWLPSYYQPILVKNKKEALFEYEPFWRDDFDKLWDPLDGSWYRFAGNTEFLISDSTLNIDGAYVSDFIRFANINNTVNDNIIILQVMCTSKSDFTPQNHLIKRFNTYQKYKLTLKIDGDYMDIIVDNDIKPIITLIGVNKNFGSMVWNVCKDEEIDVSKIIWPRRADGSMDFPPPDGVDLSKTYKKTFLNSNFLSTHKATDNLRLRETASTSAKVVTTLPKDTEVQFIETGTNATINNITAPWVKVISSTGFTGWCFSGYLEEIEENNFAVVNIAEEISTQKTNAKSTMPLPLLLAIIGGVVAVGVVIVAFLRKKK